MCACISKNYILKKKTYGKSISSNVHKNLLILSNVFIQVTDPLDKMYKTKRKISRISSYEQRDILLEN